MAKEIGLEATAEEDILQLADRTETVAETVSAMLPRDFPGEVSDPILDGLLRSANKLASDETLRQYLRISSRPCQSFDRLGNKRHFRWRIENIR